MACCGFGIPDFEEDEPLVVDLHKILSDKAWNNFVYSFGYFTRKCMKRKNYIIEVPDNYFVFERLSQEITDPGEGFRMSPPKEGESSSKTPPKKNMLDGKINTYRPSNPEAISLDTTFSNDTATQQTYQFKFSKTRTTTVEVSYQKGFTIGGKASFSIGAPKILGGGELGLESEMQYSVEKSEGQTFEESMNMEATSDITVGPKANYIANIQMEERSFNAAFRIKMRMSLPQGQAPIYIKRKKDQSLVYVYSLKNLKDAFAGEKMCTKVQEGDKIVSDKIDFTIEGYMKGSLALDHKINLTSDETEQEKAMAKYKMHHIEMVSED